LANRKRPPTAAETKKPVGGRAFRTRGGSTRAPEGEPQISRRRRIRIGGSALVVEVVDTPGRPIADVTVRLRSGEANVAVVTDEEGEAVFAEIAAGNYTIHLLRSEQPELISARGIDLAANENKRLTLRMGEYDLNISGRVLSRDGTPVSGIVVQAQRYLFHKDESDVVPGNQSQQSAISGADGEYEIGDLMEGEYVLKTVATKKYSAAKVIVRAGIEAQDLILDEAQGLTLYGEVRELEGSTLPGVLVSVVGQPSARTRTAADGTYSLEVSVADQSQIYSFEFSLLGYRRLRLKLSGEEVSETKERELDAELEPLGPMAVVSGVISVADVGEPIPGETVYLHSAALDARYAARSDGDGRYSLEVQVGETYRLWIYPEGAFKDFAKPAMSVPEDGLQLDIALEPLGSGRLLGVIVDSEGHPLPGFSFWLRSSMAMGRWLQVTGDDDGNFELDQVPAGGLFFDTRSPPRIKVHGVQLEADTEKDVELVVDWGEQELTGQVTDKRYEALVGAPVELHWGQTAKGVSSSALRRAVTDDEGHFKFTQLGPGEHRLKISLDGYKTYQSNHDVAREARELEIRLWAE